MVAYYLQKIDEDEVEDLELTESEYNCFAREIRKKRADEVVQSIKKLGEIIGVAEAKSMIRAALREIQFIIKNLKNGT